MIRRFVALLVVAVVLVLAPACDYGDSVAWAAEVATGSDADILDLPLYGDVSYLLANATEEELERYYQSFLDYPVSLLEWPEEVPQPRFAIAAVGAAAVWVLKALAVAAGIYVGVEFTENVWRMFQNYETYLRLNGDETLLESWQSILQAQWGGAVTGMVPQYRMFKQFCKEEVQGYGTDAPELSIPPASSVDFPYYSNFDSASYFPSGYAFGISTFVLSYMDFYFKEPIPVLYNVSDYGKDAKQLSIPRSILQNYKTGWCVTVYESRGALSVFESTLSSTVMVSVASLQSFPIPVFDNEEDAENYLLTGDTTGVLNAPTVFVPAKQWSDVQNKDFADIADTLVVPIGQAAADEIESNISAAAGAAEVAKALEKTWDLGQAQEGTDEEAYPWVPSITGWLEGIKSGIDSIKEKVTAIPETLARILDGVLAIPGQIADFFTLDTAVVSAEFAALQDAFTVKFAGISLLADVFTKSYSFDMTVPVFTVPVPETLREMFGGQTEVVIMDLRPHTELFLRLRGLLVAMFWVAFAKWLLDQFDVKFHVG